MAAIVSNDTQQSSSNTKFEDIFSFNINEGESIQNRIRIVTVSGKNYIAFSRYFLQKDTQKYLPTKTHFFLSAELWPSVKTGLKLLNGFLRAEAKKNGATNDTKGTRGIQSVRGDIEPELSSRKQFSMSFKAPIFGATPISSTLHATDPSILDISRNSVLTGNVSTISTFKPIPPSIPLSIFGYKRSRGRPPKSIPLEPVDNAACSSHQPETSSLSSWPQTSLLSVGKTRFGAKHVKFDDTDGETTEAKKSEEAEDCCAIDDLDLDECC